MCVCGWDVKLLYVKFIVVYVRKREGEAGGGEGARDTESKTRTPHKDVGKNTSFRAPASSPKESPCNIHAAITMRFTA